MQNKKKINNGDQRVRIFIIIIKMKAWTWCKNNVAHTINCS